MTFDELVLHNFAAYRGRQVVQLAPPSAEKPVILFGGLNGGGKTTLLDAIQLALYGKRARCSNREGLAYEEFLRRSVHRGVPPAEGAAVELAFRQRVEGKWVDYRVNRTWTVGNSGVREHLDVLVDGQRDDVAADSWAELVEEFLPLGLSPLFLFDGEKIEALADFGKSTDLLATAINSLLGVETVDQLHTDLSALERQKRMEGRPAEDKSALDRLRLPLEAGNARVAELVGQCAEARNDVELRERVVDKAEERFRKAGGDLYQRRQALDEQEQVLRGQLRSVETELRILAGGAAPFLLLRDLLTSTIRQDEIERVAADAQVILQLLLERDGETVGFLRSAALPAIADQVSAHLDRDRQRRTMTISSQIPRLALHPEARAAMRDLQDRQLSTISAEGNTLLLRCEQLDAALTAVSRQLEGIPKTDQIAPLLQELDKGRVRLAEAKLRLSSLEGQLAEARQGQELAQARFNAELERNVGKSLANSDLTRVVEHSARVRETLARFKRAVTAKHVSRLETLVLDSFRSLLRKRALVTGISIDPDTLDVTLLGGDGTPISPERLSAGERQLLAVSLLWGLARASGRPLPSIIDTPLGRLDREHRTNVVERYFPFASHQVLLLSTNEEVNEKFYETLKPWIGRSYTLEHDDATRSTKIEAGYFW